MTFKVRVSLQDLLSFPKRSKTHDALTLTEVLSVVPNQSVARNRTFAHSFQANRLVDVLLRLARRFQRLAGVLVRVPAFARV